MTLTKSKTVKDFAMVLTSNLLVLLSNVLTGLVIPRLLVVRSYKLRILKIFTLYLGTALLHFGFVDGILLFHAVEDYNTINKYKLLSSQRCW